MRDKDFEKLKKEMEEFEEGFPEGVYAVPSNPKGTRIKVHELFSYCKKYGKDPESLDKKEMEQFLVYPSKEERDLNNLLDEFDGFDKHFSDGVFVDPGETEEPKVRFRALSKYCAECGVNPEDLTDEEREKFIIDPDQDERQ